MGIGSRWRQDAFITPTYLEDEAVLYLVLHRVVFSHQTTHDGVPVERRYRVHSF